MIPPFERTAHIIYIVCIAKGIGIYQIKLEIWRERALGRGKQHPPPPKKRQKRVIWSFELASKCKCGVKSPKEAWTLLRRWCIWSMQDINTFFTHLDTCLNALYHCVRAVRLNKFRSLWRDTHESDYMIRMNHWRLSCYNTLLFSYLRVYLPSNFLYIYIYLQSFDGNIIYRINYISFSYFFP